MKSESDAPTDGPIWLVRLPSLKLITPLGAGGSGWKSVWGEGVADYSNNRNPALIRGYANYVI